MDPHLPRAQELGRAAQPQPRCLVDKLFYDSVAAYESYPDGRNPTRTSTQAQKLTVHPNHLLRGKNLNYDPNWLRTIPSCFFNLTKNEVESMVSALDYDAARKIVEESYYAKYFQHKATPEETIATAEKAFRAAILQKAKKSVIRETFNVGSTLSFITIKEAEVHNLTALTLGVEGGLKQAIRNQLLF